jgi:hypothetical protein
MASLPSGASADVSAYGARTRWAFYLIAIVFPIGGLILWAVLSGRSDAGSRRIARNALYASLSMIMLACACVLVDTFLLMPSR